MTPALQLEILDLRHFSAASLRSLLEAEARVWSERLEWDYRASANLLLQYLDSRVLPGYVAIEGGRISGYVFCVYEDHKAVIGDVFAVPPHNSDATATEVENRLLENLIELLQNSPGVDRIESQLLLHPHGLHIGVFRSAGFETSKRLFLRLSVRDKTGPRIVRKLPDDLVMRPWKDEDFNPAAHLISTAYEGHLDSHINDQYRSVAGSLRFLHNIVRFPGCGFFDPAASRVLVRPGSHELAGVLLCSRVREDVAHITQLCVARPYQGRGCGRILIDACVDDIRRREFRALTLTVTEGNEGAVSLYRHAGFVEMHSFDAVLWERKK
ncbi:ribosomal protein S18 acetylase RimI-like enzyme [Silvibacterium bohemicum]|uniref:Ribosomal protein S18 acetylase RimI-like enzyme n=1 Tax=Silvibacterium bohemicum TaxID=1577686 RepID=A0A841JTH9_9BACT|nr:GNAT family N-acetyltransferase [Silvibacterium bohemicum]MBB6144636.1 ribosomal protein S18 acetylase RimI-like enzyme [Silvibacterium bohemicum]